MIAPSYWRLEEAVDLVRALQAPIRKYGYHLCIGGGVVNAGRSDHDLDLYFLSMDNGDTKIDPDALIAHLESLWGKGLSLDNNDPPTFQRRVRAEFIGEDTPLPLTPGAIVEGPLPRRFYPTNPDSPYCAKLMFKYSDLCIDAFVVGGERAKVKEEKEEGVDTLLSSEILARGRRAMERARTVERIMHRTTPIPVPGTLAQPTGAQMDAQLEWARRLQTRTRRGEQAQTENLWGIADAPATAANAPGNDQVIHFNTRTTGITGGVVIP